MISQSSSVQHTCRPTSTCIKGNMWLLCSSDWTNLIPRWIVRLATVWWNTRTYTCECHCSFFIKFLSKWRKLSVSHKTHASSKVHVDPYTHARTLAHPAHPLTHTHTPRTRAPTHPRTRASAHPRTHAPTHPRTHAPAHPRSHVPTQPLT